MRQIVASRIDLFFVFSLSAPGNQAVLEMGTGVVALKGGLNRLFLLKGIVELLADQEIPSGDKNIRQGGFQQHRGRAAGIWQPWQPE